MNVLAEVRTKLKNDGVKATIIAILIFPFSLHRRLMYRDMLKQRSAKQKFSAIYQNNFWRSPESSSGEGSEVSYTKILRNWLVLAIPKYNVHTFVDAPCGDFNWMQLVLPKVDIEYFGFDIVDSVICKNKKEFSNSAVHFGVADICEDELPSCDFLMVRDCLFHLSNEDIDRFLKNISCVDYKYLLTTTHIVDSTHNNLDISTGDFRFVDLFSAPFCFDNNSVIERINDYPVGHNAPREMILIAKVDVPQQLVRNVLL